MREMKGLKEQRRDFRNRENKESRLIIETDDTLTDHRRLTNTVSGEVIA